MATRRRYRCGKIETLLLFNQFRHELPLPFAEPSPLLGLDSLASANPLPKRLPIMAAAGAVGGNYMGYIDFVLRYPDLPWDWHTMTDTVIAAKAVRIVFDNPGAPWDWVWLSHKLPLGTILSRPKLPWDYLSLSDTFGFAWLRRQLRSMSAERRAATLNDYT